MAAERKRSAGDYEQQLRRQELAAGRALVQALPAEGRPGARELAAARRVLTQALFDLRRLGRNLDHEIESLRSKRVSSARPGPGDARPAPRSTPGRGAGPGELDRLEALRGAVEEVAERWEGRRDQLGAELDRRQPRHARRPGPASQPRAGQQQTRQPRQRPDRNRDGGGITGRGSGAPARPESPRSRRSRRSPG